ncbi:hypothetical protein INR49_004859 [Caranx melampygus]|nr:hypothetical protein INR49_004859 [Caranx melampygus]
MSFLSELQLSSFKPELETESTQLSYSVGLVDDSLKGHQLDHSWTSSQFRCPGPGQFQCTSTGLVFVMDQEAELFYKTVQWDESLLQSVGKMAAGPLFSIRCPEDAVHQLHLPHCETKEGLHCDGLLSVAHITDDGISFIEPLEITDTHVIISVPHLSFFGLVWVKEQIRRFSNNMKPVCGQVLLFRRPNLTPRMQSLNVLLLPNNVHLAEVNGCWTTVCSSGLLPFAHSSQIKLTQLTVHRPTSSSLRDINLRWTLDQITLQHFRSSCSQAQRPPL